MTTKTPKYRPSFTAEEIVELHSYITHIPKEFVKSAALRTKIATKIATLAFKLESGLASASYSSTSKESLLESLGESISEPVDPNVLRLQTYEKYISTPDECTEDELLTAIEYKELVIKEPLTPKEKAVIDASWGM